jgi:hypothetical protein
VHIYKLGRSSIESAALGNTYIAVVAFLSDEEDLLVPCLPSWPVCHRLYPALRLRVVSAISVDGVRVGGPQLFFAVVGWL